MKTFALAALLVAPAFAATTPSTITPADALAQCTQAMSLASANAVLSPAPYIKTCADEVSGTGRTMFISTERANYMGAVASEQKKLAAEHAKLMASEAQFLNKLKSVATELHTPDLAPDKQKSFLEQLHTAALNAGCPTASVTAAVPTDLAKVAQICPKATQETIDAGNASLADWSQKVKDAINLSRTARTLLQKTSMMEAQVTNDKGLAGRDALLAKIVAFRKLCENPGNATPAALSERFNALQEEVAAKLPHYRP